MRRAPKSFSISLSSTTGPHDLQEELSGTAKDELVATTLVLEAIDVAEGPRDGDIEDEVG